MTPRFWDAGFDTLAWDDLRAWQLKQLPEFVDRLRNRSELYRAKLPDTRGRPLATLHELGELPFTTKDDLRAGQGEEIPGKPLGLQQCAPTDALVQVLSSSGTTGKPVYFGLTADDSAAWQRSIGNMYFTMGMSEHSRVALMTATPMVAGGLPYADALRETGAMLAWLGGQPTDRAIEMFLDLQLNSIVCTVTFVRYLAEKVPDVLDMPASELGIRTVIGGGEPGLGEASLRAAIRDAWGAERIAEGMGLGDVMAGMWGECGAEHGMHFTAGRHVLVELIDPTTEEQVPWEQGARGEAVYTTFTREATPVLRFRSRDHMEVTATACPCGRTAPAVRCVGRTDDMLIYKAMNVFPSAIRDTVLSAGAGVVRDRVRILKAHDDQVRFDEPIPVEVESRQDLSAEGQRTLQSRLEQAVREKLKVRIRVEFVPAGSIPVDRYKNQLVHTARSS